MCKAVRFLCLFVIATISAAVRGDVAAIRASELPQETAVLAALDDARAMEPYSQRFTANWEYPVSKEDVAARLGKDLGFLRIANQAHPDNVELLLLTGLIARYAYNVDVDSSYDTAMEALHRSEKLAPGDVRAPWFRATLLCQTSQPKAGAEGFLAIEASHPWEKLPAAFWGDYMECASVTGMPAHVLRAADHLKQIHAPETQMGTFLAGIAAKRFDAFDPQKKYEPKEIWSANDLGEGVEFTSTTCGVRVRAEGKWRVNQMAWNGGSCVAYFSTGPYHGTVRSLHPSVLVMVTRPKDAETLDDFAKKFMKDGAFEAYTPSRCPAERCLAYKQDSPGMYEKDGNGHGRIVLFERDEPQYPGLLFERPWQLPKGTGNGVQYYRPEQVQRRIPGKLYYLVLLDAAASIEEPAMKDFDFFLQNLTVE